MVSEGYQFQQLPSQAFYLNNANVVILQRVNFYFIYKAKTLKNIHTGTCQIDN